MYSTNGEPTAVERRRPLQWVGRYVGKWIIPMCPANGQQCQLDPARSATRRYKFLSGLVLAASKLSNLSRFTSSQPILHNVQYRAPSRVSSLKFMMDVPVEPSTAGNDLSRRYRLVSLEDIDTSSSQVVADSAVVRSHRGESKEMFILTPPFWWLCKPLHAELRQSPRIFSVYCSFTRDNHIELKDDRHVNDSLDVWSAPRGSGHAIGH